MEGAFQRARYTHHNAVLAKCAIPFEHEFNEEMTERAKKNGVSEIYSFPRVVRVASEFEFAEGWRSDVTVIHGNGENCGSSKPHMRDTALLEVILDKITLIIGPPPCTIVPFMMGPDWSKFREEDMGRRMNDARVHLAFCLDIHRTQHAAGRCFPHVRP